MESFTLDTVDIEIFDGDLPHDYFIAAKGKKIGVDTETNGLDYKVNDLAMVQIYVPGKGVAFIRNVSHTPTVLVNLLESTKVHKIFHYSQFDLKFLSAHIPGLQPASILDTKIAAKILDPQNLTFFSQTKQKYSQSLEALVWYYFGYQMDKSIATTNWFSAELTPEQIRYGAADVFYLPKLLSKLETELRTKNPEGLINARNSYKYIPTKVALQLKNINDVFGY